MSTVTLQLELPDDRADFSLPPALESRLSKLLDQQDKAGALDESDRLEAEALCELIDMLALLKLRAERSSGQKYK